MKTLTATYINGKKYSPVKECRRVQLPQQTKRLVLLHSSVASADESLFRQPLGLKYWRAAGVDSCRL